MEKPLVSSPVHLQSSLFRRRDHGQHCTESFTAGGKARNQVDKLSVTEDDGNSKQTQYYTQGIRNQPSLTQSRESENDVLMQALLSDLRAAKKGFKGLNKEVNEHNSLLDNLGRQFTEARMSLGATMRSLDRIGLGSFKHMWLLFIFVVVFFMFIYFMLRFRR